MPDAIVWNPRVGDTGDDRYAYGDNPPKAGNSAFVDPDAPNLADVTGTQGLNQVSAETHRRYFLNTFTKLTVASLPYVGAGAKCRTTEMIAPRTHINNTIRYYENRGYFPFSANPIAGNRMTGLEIFELRKSLAYETLTGNWFLCRGPSSNLSNSKYCLCSKMDEGNTPVAWRGVPLPLQSAWLRPVVGIFNGQIFGPQARFDDASCQTTTVYMPDGTGTPQARIGFVRQIGSRLIARGQTRVGGVFGGFAVYSDDWGQTWTRCAFPDFSQNGFTWLFRAITSSNILRLASGRLLVAGTTNRADDASFEHGDAIWYSDDSGTTWNGRLVYPHRDSAFVYAGTPSNLFEYAGHIYMFNVSNQFGSQFFRHDSTDGGLTWGNRQPFTPSLIGNFTRVWTFSTGAVVLHINNDPTNSPSPVQGITWRSVDLGLTWTNIYAQHNLQGVCKMGDDLYALIPDAISGFFNFCRSIDAGGNFSVVCQTDIPIDSFRGYPSGTETTYCNNLVAVGMEP